MLFVPKNIISAMATGIFSEAGGKWIFELVKNLGQEKIKERIEKVKKVENERARIVYAFLSLGDEVKNLKKYHRWAAEGKLFDYSGKRISENRFIYLLTLIKPERLESALRELDKLPQREFQQMLQMLDQDALGDSWHTAKKKIKQAWKAIQIIFANIDWKKLAADLQSLLTKQQKKIKRKTNKAMRELDQITEDSLKKLDNLEF